MSLAPKFSLQIDTRWCLDALLKAGRITQRDANLIATTSRRKEQITWHPGRSGATPRKWRHWCVRICCAKGSGGWLSGIGASRR